MVLTDHECKGDVLQRVDGAGSGLHAGMVWRAG